MRPGAIFDLDGTLVRGTSAERLFVPFLRRNGVLGVRQWLPFLAQAILFPIIGWTAAMRRNKRYLTGVEVARIEGLLPEFLETMLEDHLCTPLIGRLDSLRNDGFVLCLLTGAPDFLAQAIGRRLRTDDALGTSLEVRDNRFTGRLAGPHYFGRKKVDGVHSLASKHELQLSQSHGFADHVHDIPFLKCFGHPVAVDPKRGLRRYARRHGWEILRC